MRIEFNNVRAQAIVEDSTEKQALVLAGEQMAPFIPGFSFTPHFKNAIAKRKDIIKQVYKALKDPTYEQPPAVSQFLRQWRVKLLGVYPDRGIFGTGLLPLVIEKLAGEPYYIRPHLIDQRPVQSYNPGASTLVPLRGYQWEAVRAAIGNTEFGLWWPRGILYHATGAGKTEMAAAMIDLAKVPTMFLVHRLDLLYQAKERFEKYGIDVGVIGDGVFDPRPQGTTVSTIQTLHSIIHGTDTGVALMKLHFLKGIEQVFFDEAHLMAAKYDKGNQFVQVAEKFTGAYMRWGLTATPGMRDKYSNWLLEGVTGKVVHEIRSAKLIEQKYLTPPKVVFVQAPVVAKVNAKNWQEAYTNGIVLNAGRNRKVGEILREVPKPCLILVNKVAHGKELARVTGAVFVHGDTPVETRTKTVEAVRAGALPALIASTIFDEGVDIPNLRTIILAGGGKSQIKMLQRIGRGLRLAERKDEVLIVDFYDTVSATLKKHSEERAKTCRDEGFLVEGI